MVVYAARLRANEHGGALDLPTASELGAMALGYRQRLIMAQLTRGEWVRNPAYWRGGRRVIPRRSELRSWKNLRQRLTTAGYALEVHREPGCAAGDETYRLLHVTEVR